MCSTLIGIKYEYQEKVSIISIQDQNGPFSTFIYTNVYQLNNMVDAQKNPIPDFSLQESYYHLFQRLGERNSGLTTYASKIFKSCCFEPEIIETK
jgi:hypothetical protein